MVHVEKEEFQDSRNETYSSLGRILSASISLVIPRDASGACGATPSEVAALAQICTMGAVPSGKEDPKCLLRTLSDGVLNRVAAMFWKMAEDPVAKKVSNFFLVEWCWRHGHLHGDWTWTWDGPGEGYVRCCPKISLESAAKKLGLAV